MEIYNFSPNNNLVHLLNIISHHIEKSKQIGINKLSVETGAGDFFAPARKLFKNFGFKECGPFAHYKDDPNSCYYSVDI